MTDKSVQIRKAETFRRMHTGPGALLLPNAWDAMSARLFEEAGFAAIATTSAGLAWSLGYRDGEYVPREEMLTATARIVRVVGVPVNADIEAGFGDTPEALADTVTRVIATGVAGINLEDGTHRPDTPVRSPAEAAARIQAAREAADTAAVPIVINARTDLYLLEIGDENQRFDATLDRARAYLAAGADCFYPIGLADLDTIAALTGALDAPVNIVLHADDKSLADFQRAGVARASCGIGPVCAVMEFLREQAKRLHATGRLDAPIGAFTHSGAQALFPTPGP
jgi:2-methylisocitrate lyase-like PEP mutase family enzyme